MSERAERRRHRLATGIFHQPKDEPDHIFDPEDFQAAEKPLCPSSDQALAGSSDVVPPRPVIREDGLGQKCQANVGRADEPEVCAKPATEAVVEHGDYVPVCSYHAMIARRNHWAVGHLK